MSRSTNVVGEKNTHFLSDHYKFFENDKIEKRTLLNATNNKLEPFLYHLGKCGADSFKTVELSQIHSFYLNSGEDREVNEVNVSDEDDEDSIKTNYCNGTNEVVNFFLSEMCYML